MKLGYVGLGNMGGALARRLTTHHDVLVYDRDPLAVRRLVDCGATAVASLGDIAASSEVVLLCLPTSEHVREVIFSLDGLASTAKSGLMIIDQTTGDPLATRAMAEELRARGVCLVDAPVSGGTQGAEGGTIAIMVGGTDDEYLRATSVLSAISPNHFHAGAVGAGHVMKLVNNLLSGAQRLVALEGMALAVKNGVDPRVAHQILLAGGGRSAYLERTFPAEVLTGQLNPGFTLSLMHKDIRLACQLGLESAVPMFFGSLTREFYQMCLNEHGPTAQVETAALAVDRLAGTHIVPSKLEMQEPTFE